MPPAVLIYDAECPACRASALWLMKRATVAGARATDLELLPSRSSARRARYPAISEATCAAAMQLVVPAGDVFSGAEAVPEIVRRVPRWRWIAILLALPGARRAARRAYAWIADHRMRLRCPLPPAQG